MKKITLKKITNVAFILMALTLSSHVNAVQVSQTAPDFTLKSLTGENLNLEEQRGKIVVINFWASWCGPCRKEMPILQDIQSKYEDLGILVWGINVEQNNEAGRKFLANVDIDFPIFFDDKNILSDIYDVQAMPTTVIIDRNGVVRYQFQGYRDGYDKKYARAIKKLIREK